jgi:hypothetical protein
MERFQGLRAVEMVAVAVVAELLVLTDQHTAELVVSEVYMAVVAVVLYKKVVAK